ncbi:MAG: 4a-hydroxytetrahydrobiopterin dehydratase [bacterium]|nr:4a-hydroxytetrahydrobiopterin dehydratase [bacterium]
MEDLKLKKCIPCESGALPFDKEQIGTYLKKLDPSWTHVHEEGVDKIRRQFQFGNFTKAMDFVNKIAIIAEHEQHHPDIHIWYDKVLIVLWTHAVKGLSENDFIVAAKLNEL